MKIGQIEGEKQQIRPNLPGELSTVSDHYRMPHSRSSSASLSGRMRGAAWTAESYVHIDDALKTRSLMPSRRGSLRCSSRLITKTRIDSCRRVSCRHVKEALADSQRCENSSTRSYTPMLSSAKRAASERARKSCRPWRELDYLKIWRPLKRRANNMNRMRLGPGKHLHGQELMGGIVKGEDFDYFQWAVYVPNADPANLQRAGHQPGACPHRRSRLR